MGRAGRWLLRGLSAILIAGSLASATWFEQWWIRVWDFPRLQIFFALGVLAVLTALLDRKTRPLLPLALALCAAWQGYRIFPHTFLAPTEVKSAAAVSNNAACMRVFAFNVLQDNRNYAEALDLIRAENPDVILLTETDKAWAAALEPVLRGYALALNDAGVPVDMRLYAKGALHVARSAQPAWRSPANHRYAAAL